MERASVATDGDSRTAMDGPNLKQSCPLEWVPQGITEQLQFFKSTTNVQSVGFEAAFDSERRLRWD